MAPRDERLELNDRFARAMGYAHAVHADHWRKRTTIPYVAHLLAVASLVLEGGGDEDQAIAALLHDSAEDRPLPPRDGLTGGEVRVEDIRERFGDRVAGMVRDLSDTLDKHGERRSWAARKQDYLDEVRSASAEAPHLLVSVADKLHNCRAVVRDLRDAEDPATVWGRFSGKRTGTCWYYDTLRRTYREVGVDSVLLDQLDREVDALLAIAGLTGQVPTACPSPPEL